MAPTQNFPPGAGPAPCMPLFLSVHRALDYLLKIYFEGFLFCFVSLLDTLE